MRIRSLILLLACLAALGGCGEREDEREAPATDRPASGEATPAGEITTDLSAKPTIPTPQGEPPAELQTEDVVKGDGPRARKGDQVSVQYVGIAWSTGAEFDASWDRGQPFAFRLGAGQVIPGWDRGVAGMRVGGRRKLVIPPDLGYGAQGAGPDIGPGETLVFVVDLERID